jgi:hypothetical protein
MKLLQEGTFKVSVKTMQFLEPMLAAELKELGATDIERVEQMIKLAREQIKRLALVDEKDIAIINREVAQLGGQDTAGMLLRLARLDLTHVDDGA